MQQRSEDDSRSAKTSSFSGVTEGTVDGREPSQRLQIVLLLVTAIILIVAIPLRQNKAVRLSPETENSSRHSSTSNSAAGSDTISRDTHTPAKSHQQGGGATGKHAPMERKPVLRYPGETETENPTRDGGSQGATNSAGEPAPKNETVTPKMPRQPQSQIGQITSSLLSFDQSTQENVDAAMERILREKIAWKEKWTVYESPLFGAMPKIVFGDTRQRKYLLKLTCPFEVSKRRTVLTKSYDAMLATALDEILLGRGDPKAHGIIVPTKSFSRLDKANLYKHPNECKWSVNKIEFFAGALLRFDPRVQSLKGNCSFFVRHAADASQQWILDILLGQADRYCNHNTFKDSADSHEVFLDFDDGTYFNTEFCRGYPGRPLKSPFFTKTTAKRDESSYCRIAGVAVKEVHAFPSAQYVFDALRSWLHNDEWFRLFPAFHYFHSDWMKTFRPNLCTQNITLCRIERGLGVVDGVSNICVDRQLSETNSTNVADIVISTLSSIYSRRTSMLFRYLRAEYGRKCGK